MTQIKIDAKLDELVSKVDSFCKRVDDWSPEARQAAAESRKSGVKARQTGRSETENPHYHRPGDDPERKSWAEGWNSVNVRKAWK